VKTASLPDRLRSTVVILALLFVGLIGRLVYLQVGQNDLAWQQAANLREKTMTFSAERGVFLDRRGALLVSNRDRQHRS
jgi:cell division protein FtsI/penicillin-binding protein 2